MSHYFKVLELLETAQNDWPSLLSRLEAMRSKMLQAAFGEAVVRHYGRAASWEIEEFTRVVTDYEVARGFERA